MAQSPIPFDIDAVLRDEESGALDPKFAPVLQKYRDMGRIPPAKPKPTTATEPAPDPNTIGVSVPPSSPSFGQKALAFGKDLVTAPETIAGVASMIPGVGTGAAGAIGAGTSLARDLYQGERDPVSLGTHAAIHGGLSMIPAGLGNLAEKGGLHAADVALGLAGGGKWKAVKALFGLAKPSAPTAAVADNIAEHVFPDGLKVVSSDGLKRLVQQVVDYENSPGMKAPVLKKMEEYIAEVTKHVGAPTTSSAMQQAGVQILTAAQQKSKALLDAAKLAAERWTNYGRVGGALIGSQVHSPDTTRIPTDITLPPSKKP